MPEPFTLLVVGLWLGVLAAAIFALRAARDFKRAQARLQAPEAEERAAAAEEAAELVVLGPFVTKRPWIPIALAAAVGATFSFLGFKAIFVGAFVTIALVLSLIADGVRVERRFSII